MMNKKFSKTEIKGLPGGPNEQFTYVTGVFLQDMYHVPIAQKGLEKYQGNGKSETLVPKEKLDRYLRNTQAKLIDDSGVPLYEAYDDGLPTPTVRAYNVPTAAEKARMIGSTLKDKTIEAAKTIKDVSPIGAAQRLYKRGSDELGKDITSFGQSFVNYLKNPLPYYRSTPEEQERSGSILDIAEVVPFVGLGAKGLKSGYNALRKGLFQSKPNWKKWNPDTRKYPELIKEYKDIEKATKKAGTWMKNPDGSPFQGPPELFIQVNSSWFKKAFPEGYEEVFRGARPSNVIKELDPGKGMFTANFDLASKYTNKKEQGIITPFYKFNSGRWKRQFDGSWSIDPDAKGGIFKLAHRKSPNSFELNFNETPWTRLPLKTKEELLLENQNLIDNTLKRRKELYETNPELYSEEIIKGGKTDMRLNYLLRQRELLKNTKENDKHLLEKLRETLGETTHTDRFAKYLEDNNLDYIKLNKIDDDGLGDVSIINHKPGNFLKSLQGNVGFFDMNNPNIFKALTGATATGGLLANENNKQQGGALEKYQTKGEVYTYENNPEYFDNKAVLGDGYDIERSDKIKKLIYAGTHGYDPKTGAIVKINGKPASDLVRAQSSRDAQQAYRYARNPQEKKPTNLTKDELRAISHDVRFKDLQSLYKNPVFLAPGALALGSAVGPSALKLLANPLVSAPLSAYGYYDATTNSIPSAVKATKEGRYLDAAGNASMAALDLFPLPFLGTNLIRKVKSSFKSMEDKNDLLLDIAIREALPFTKTSKARNIQKNNLDNVVDETIYSTPRINTHPNQSLLNLSNNLENLNRTLDRLNIDRDIVPNDFIPRIIVQPNQFIRRQTPRIQDFTPGAESFITNNISRPRLIKVPLTNRSGFTREAVQNKFPDIDLKNISDDEFKRMYLTPKGELIMGSPNKGIDYEKITRQEYEDIFNSRLDLLNDIVEKNRLRGSLPYSITGLKDNRITFRSRFGESDWPVHIREGLIRGQVEDIANLNYIMDYPGIAMYNTLSGVYGTAKNKLYKGSRAYDSIREYLKMLDLGTIKSGQSGQTASSRGLWENVQKKGRGFGIYKNPLEVAGIYYKEGGEGYREGAPNYNATSKLIPSGNITMTEKDGGPLKKGPLLGIDNLGNQQMMYPGYNYQFPGNMVMEIPVMQKAQFGKHFSGKDAYLDVFGNVVPINEGGLKAITGEATLKYGTEDNPMYLRSSLKPFAGYTTDGFNLFDIQGSSGIGIGSKGYNAELGFTKNLLNNQKPSLYTSVGYNDEKFGINASTNIPNKNNPYIFPNLNLRYTPNEMLSINADATYDPIARSPRVQAGLNYRFQTANKPKLEKGQYGVEKALSYGNDIDVVVPYYKLTRNYEQGGEMKELVKKYTTKGWNALNDNEKKAYKHYYNKSISK